MGVRIGKIVSLGDAQPLSQSLIAAKKEGLILGNGAPQGKSKLVALKTGRITPLKRVIGVSVKEVAGIQRTVGTGYLYINGELQGEADMPKMHITTYSLAETFDIGIDYGTQVDPNYEGSPFAFTGTLDRVIVTLTD